MPELPEVETIRISLEKILTGKKISKITILRKESVAYPAIDKFKADLPNKEIRSISRRGKYLFLDLENNFGLAIHLRMSGRLLLIKEKKNFPKHTRIIFKLNDANNFIFDDVRVFGRIWLKYPNETFEDLINSLNELGPEPWDKSLNVKLAKSFANKTQAIKSTILDQKIIAGVGNIYADESLHLAKIHPSRKASSLKQAEIARLINNIQKVLKNSIKLGGSSLRNYTNTEGVNGNYQGQAYVYGRKNKACRFCGNMIERIKIAGRSTHFCPICQPLYPKRVKKID